MSLDGLRLNEDLARWNDVDASGESDRIRKETLSNLRSIKQTFPKNHTFSQAYFRNVVSNTFELDRH